MSFVVSRKEVGYFGYISRRRNVILFHSPWRSTDETRAEESVTLTCPAVSTQQKDKLRVSSDKKNIPNPKLDLNCGAISNCGNFLAVSDESKLLHLWERHGNQWHLISSRSLYRKGFRVLFTNSGSHVIVADRSGDIFSFSVREAFQNAKFVLGHVCIILDVELTDSDDYIFTCDRDGKIRVSNFPNAYNIETYCLGHREFVSALKVCSSTDKILLSGSGDGTLRLWKYDVGKEILCCDLKKYAPLISNVEEMDCETSGTSNFMETKSHDIETHASNQISVVVCEKQEIALECLNSPTPDTPSLKCSALREDIPESESVSLSDAISETANTNLEVPELNQSVYLFLDSKPFNLALLKKIEENVKLESVPFSIKSLEESDSHLKCSSVPLKKDNSSFMEIDNSPGKRVGVKCFKYCTRTQTCAVLFYTHSKIAIFRVITAVSHEAIEFVQFLNFESDPQDAYFDIAGHLWVILSSEDVIVSIFKQCESGHKFQFVPVEGDVLHDADKICSEIRKNWKSLPGTLSASDLYKQSYMGGFGKSKHTSEKQSFDPKCKKNKIQ